MPFTPIGDALQNNTKKKPSENTAAVEAAAQVFGSMFNKELAVHVKPLFLKNRTLTVTCSSNEMAQEIREKQAEIVEKINEKIGNNEVDRIRYLA